MPTKISIIMAAYNAASFIHEAISSVQRQTHANWELLVVDDASKDDTAAVVQRLADADNRIRLIKSPHNGGPGAARNMGLSAANGTWVTVLDSDDRFMPTRLERLLQFADKNDLDVVVDNQYLYNLKTAKVFDQGFHASSNAYELTPEMLLRNDCLGQWFPFGLLKPFMRRSVLTCNNMHYPDIRLGEDFCLFFSFLLHCPGRAALLTEPLYIYTPQIHSNRSKTAINAQAWTEYRSICRDYLTREAQRLAPADKELMAAIRKRDRSLAQYIIWSELRDRSHKYVFARKWLVLFRPLLWPMVVTAIRKKLSKKHPIPYAGRVFTANVTPGNKHSLNSINLAALNI